MICFDRVSYCLIIILYCVYIIFKFLSVAVSKVAVSFNSIPLYGTCLNIFCVFYLYIRYGNEILSCTILVFNEENSSVELERLTGHILLIGCCRGADGGIFKNFY